MINKIKHNNKDNICYLKGGSLYPQFVRYFSHVHTTCDLTMPI